MKVLAKIAPENWLLAFLGIADLVSTVHFLQRNGAAEANPLIAHFWQLGLPIFIVAKGLCILGPLLILEWARRHRPRFVSYAMRSAIAGYAGMYALGCLQLNGPAAQAAEIHYATSESAQLIHSSACGRYHAMQYYVRSAPPQSRGYMERELEKAAQVCRRDMAPTPAR